MRSAAVKPLVHPAHNPRNARASSWAPALWVAPSASASELLTSQTCTAVTQHFIAQTNGDESADPAWTSTDSGRFMNPRTPLTATQKRDPCPCSLASHRTTSESLQPLWEAAPALTPALVEEGQKTRVRILRVVLHLLLATMPFTWTGGMGQNTSTKVTLPGRGRVQAPSQRLMLSNHLRPATIRMVAHPSTAEQCPPVTVNLTSPCQLPPHLASPMVIVAVEVLLLLRKKS